MKNMWLKISKKDISKAAEREQKNLKIFEKFFPEIFLVDFVERSRKWVESLIKCWGCESLKNSTAVKSLYFRFKVVKP